MICIPVHILAHPTLAGWPSWVHEHSTRHATGHFPEAQCAFKILMIHEVLQFALRIAFRCVLHRCGSLDIHRWKLYVHCWYMIWDSMSGFLPEHNRLCSEDICHSAHFHFRLCLFCFVLKEEKIYSACKLDSRLAPILPIRLIKSFLHFGFWASTWSKTCSDAWPGFMLTSLQRFFSLSHRAKQALEHTHSTSE